MYYRANNWLNNGPRRPGCWGGGLRGLGLTDQDVFNAVMNNTPPAPACMPDTSYGPLQPGQVYCGTGATFPLVPYASPSNGGGAAPSSSPVNWSSLVVPVGIGAALLLGFKMLAGGR